MCAVFSATKTAVCSHRKLTLASLFTLAVAFERPCQLQIFVQFKHTPRAVIWSRHLCSFFFPTIRFFVHTRCVVSCWTEELSDNEKRSILYRQARSSAIHGICELWLARSRPVMGAFSNSVACTEGLLKTNTSLLWETDTVTVAISGQYRPEIVTVTAVSLNSAHVHEKPSLKPRTF